MKKRLERISLIGFLLIILWNNFCYADVVSVSPAVNVDESLISLTWVGIVIIGLAVLIISIISFFILHIYSSIETENENEKQENMEKMHKNNRRIYVSAIVLAIMSHLLLQGIFRASIWIFLIPIILFIISICIRKKNRRISNILCVIAILIVCIIPLSCYYIEQNVKEYNGTFSKWSNTFSKWSNVSELIDLVDKNNHENNNKITITYENQTYQTTQELNILNNKLDKDSQYYIKNNGSSYSRKRITEITLNERK